jgi:hypothetical protein
MRQTVWIRWIVTGVWAAAAVIHMRPFRGGHMDSWCYFAPAAFARWPFDLTMPMLGDWHGADMAWGIQWPGNLWVWSLILPWTGSRAVLAGLFLSLLMWYALAESARRIVVRFTASEWLGLYAMVLVLTDRMVYENAAIPRAEIATLLILLGAWHWIYALTPDGGKSSPIRLGGLLAALFLLASSHVMATAVLAPVGAWFLYGAWRDRERRSYFLLLAGALAAGAAACAAWIRLQPWAWDQFVDHYYFTIYAPRKVPQIVSAIYNYAGGIFYMLFMALALAQCWREASDSWKASSSPGTWPPAFLTRPSLGLAILFLGLFILAQILHNPHYFVMSGPIGYILAAMWIWRWTAERSGMSLRITILAGLLMLVVQSGFFLQRTVLYFGAGAPNIPAATQQFVQALPRSGRLVLPTNLWEEGFLETRRGRQVDMLTIPYNVSAARRQEYQANLFARLRPGDVVVIDRFQFPELEAPIRAIGEWEVCGYAYDPLPAYEEYDMHFLALRLLARRDRPVFSHGY